MALTGMINSESIVVLRNWPVSLCASFLHLKKRCLYVFLRQQVIQHFYFQLSSSGIVEHFVPQRSLLFSQFITWELIYVYDHLYV